MPGDIARLVIEIDSNGAVTGKAHLEGLTDAGKKAEDQARKQKTSFTELNQTLELMGKAYQLLKGAVVESVAEFVEAEKAGIKLEAILRATGQAAGRTADDLNNMSARLAGKTIFDDDSITNAQALMLTFKGIRGSVYDDAIPAVMDLASAFGMDLAGASVMLGKALEDPTSGLTALRRVGVSFTEEQQEQIKAMTAAGDAARAQGEILEVLKGQVGGVAEAMGASASGSIARMEHAVDNLKEAFGRLIATNFQPLIDNMAHLMDVMSGNAFDVTGFISKDKGTQSQFIKDASAGTLDQMIRAISLYKEVAPEGSSLWKTLTSLEDVVQARVDRIEEIALKRAAASLIPKVPTSTTQPLPWEGGVSVRTEDMAEYLRQTYQGNGLGRVNSSTFLNDLIEANRFSYTDPAAPASWGPGELDTPDLRDPLKVAMGGANRSGYEGNQAVDGWDEKTRGILALRDALSLTYDEAEKMHDVFVNIDATMQNIAAQGIANGFRDVGSALANGANAGEAFGQAMIQMGVDMAQQVGQLLITAGLKMLIETSTLNPAGWAMIAAGGGATALGGYFGAKNESSQSVSPSTSRSALSVASPGASASAASKVTIHNYAGVQVETKESQGPGGRELQVLVKQAVQGAIVSGAADRALGNRFGLVPAGRSAS
jgi:hypothetical protein